MGDSLGHSKITALVCLSRQISVILSCRDRGTLTWEEEQCYGTSVQPLPSCSCRSKYVLSFRADGAALAPGTGVRLGRRGPWLAIKSKNKIKYHSI